MTTAPARNSAAVHLVPEGDRAHFGKTVSDLRFGNDGVQILPPFLDQAWIDAASRLADPLLASDGDREQASQRAKPGVRRVLERQPEFVRLLGDRSVIDRLSEFTGRPLHVVRALLFDKSPDANWLVPWHQDATIAVARRNDAVPGVSMWTMKHGTHYCRPPMDVLDGIVCIRLHLDTNDLDNGPLEVIPGSHSRGMLNAQQLDDLTRDPAGLVCCVQAGGAVVMRPHVVHRSGVSRDPSRRRRVLHLECATVGLPSGLDWAESVQFE